MSRSRHHRYLTLLADQAPPLTPAQLYIAAVQALNPGPLLWYRMDEAATPAISYGSVASVDGTVANMGAFQQAGPNAIVPLAYDYNGTTSIVTIPTAAGLNSADFTLALLLNADTAGEGAGGYFVETETTVGSTAFQFFITSNVGVLNLSAFNAAGSGFTTTTSAALTLNTWHWVFARFNATTGVVSIWRSLSSIVTECPYSLQPALTGTPRQIGRGRVGNRSDTARTFDGRIAQTMLFGSLLTTVQMQSIITASGV